MTDGKMDKQVKELAKDIYSMIRSDSMSRALASMLYGEGYRKASDVAEDIIRILRAAGINEHRYPIVAEIKKKYTEDGENE